jgi:hypothetical protein
LVVDSQAAQSALNRKARPLGNPEISGMVAMGASLIRIKKQGLVTRHPSDAPMPALLEDLDAIVRKERVVTGDLAIVGQGGESRSLCAVVFKGLKAIAELKGIGRRAVVFLGERTFRTEDGIKRSIFETNPHLQGMTGEHGHGKVCS